MRTQKIFVCWAVTMLCLLIQIRGADPLDSWVFRNSGTGYTLAMVNYGSTQFVAVGFQGTILTSPDGMAWTQRNPGTVSDIYAVAYGGGQWVHTGPAGLIRTSPDGVTWTARNAGNPNLHLFNVVYGNGRFVAVGSVGGATDSIVLMSMDGITWTSSTVFNTVLSGVTFGNGMFLTVGGHVGCSFFGCEDLPDVYSSPTGNTPWTSQNPPGGGFYLIDVHQGASMFAAVGPAGAILTSPTGTAWTQQASPVSTGLNSVNYGAGRFVAVGIGGVILSSPDGTAWTRRTSPTVNDLYEVTFGNGSFVAVGFSGMILQAVLERIQVDPISIVEGNTGGAHATFTIQLEPAREAVTQLNFSTANASAYAGSDYIQTNGLLSFAPGETSKTVSVVVNGDILDEINETFLLNLSNPTNGASLGQASATIIDDDSGTLAISEQPRDQTIAAGSTATLRIVVVSSSAVSYQWQFNGADIPGANQDTYVIAEVDPSEEGIYVVRLSNHAGTYQSDPAKLNVSMPTMFVQSPLSQAAVTGGSVTFSVAVSGHPSPFTYEWRKSSTPVFTETRNGTNSFFTLTDLAPSAAGQYRVVVRNRSNTNGVATPFANLTVLADADGDKMPDGWETANGLDLANAADALQDRDSDGSTNREEYDAGTDPNEPSSLLRIEIAAPKQLWFVAKSNKTYSVQHKEHLEGSGWTKLIDVIARPLNRLETLPATNTAAHRFFRVVTPRQP